MFEGGLAAEETVVLTLQDIVYLSVSSKAGEFFEGQANGPLVHLRQLIV